LAAAWNSPSDTVWRVCSVVASIRSTDTFTLPPLSGPWSMATHSQPPASDTAVAPGKEALTVTAREAGSTRATWGAEVSKAVWVAPDGVENRT
jgi:hypothetical protein